MGGSEIDWLGSGWRQFVDLCEPVMKIFVPQLGVWWFFTNCESEVSLNSALHYSVHKYIYRYCMSGPPNMTLL
jgi:hypothetical protein